jgi:hypothetical protein
MMVFSNKHGLNIVDECACMSEIESDCIAGCLLSGVQCCHHHVRMQHKISGMLEIVLLSEADRLCMHGESSAEGSNVWTATQEVR